MAPHSSILAWKSHGQMSLLGYSPQVARVRNNWAWTTHHTPHTPQGTRLPLTASAAAAQHIVGEVLCKVLANQMQLMQEFRRRALLVARLVCDYQWVGGGGEEGTRRNKNANAQICIIFSYQGLLQAMSTFAAGPVRSVHSYLLRWSKVPTWRLTLLSG